MVHHVCAAALKVGRVRATLTALMLSIRSERRACYTKRVKGRGAREMAIFGSGLFQ